MPDNPYILIGISKMLTFKSPEKPRAALAAAYSDKAIGRSACRTFWKIGLLPECANLVHLKSGCLGFLQALDEFGTFINSAAISSTLLFAASMDIARWLPQE